MRNPETILKHLKPPNTWRGRTRQWFNSRPEEFKTILGIACTGHGASIALATADGVIRGSVLDRWAGFKHALMLAESEDLAIRNPVNDIDRQIGFLLNHGFEKAPPIYIFEKTILGWVKWFLGGLSISSSEIDLVVTSSSHFATCELRLGNRLHQWFKNAWVSSGLEHHEIHQRQAFWQSGFDEAAVLTLDACGEQLERFGGRALAGTIAAIDAKGNSRTLKNFFFPDSSPGLLYDVVNRHVGFRLGDEGKTMGLAPYGTAELLERLEPLLQLHPDGEFEFLPHMKFEEMLTEYVPARVSGEELTQRHRNVAYAGQALLEKVVRNAFQAALRMTGRRKLAYAGGVALNSVANEIAFRAAQPESLYVSPNPGDTGHALGCALFGAYEIAGWPPALQEVPDYLGPAYSDREMIAAARDSGYYLREPAALSEELAHSIANGYITARYAGRAEFGPRALGNRSILCDPRQAGMRDYLNDRVKHRESFRPFAPAVLAEDAAEWFEIAERSAYMLRVVAVRPQYRQRVAATVHVDGSCRVQTVSTTDNPEFYQLLRAFKAITGIPVILNTSFNIAGKPIVETPRDAVECFSGTEIDVLAIGPVLVSKHQFEKYQTARPDYFPGVGKP